MRIAALLAILTISVPSVSFACAWNCTGIPVRRYPAEVYVRSRGVSTGAAVASAIAAGVLGWELGRRQAQAQPQPRPQTKQSPAAASDENCRIVKIDDEQRLVCRDERGNWQIH